MKKIKLTQGKYAMVDDSDFEWLNQWKWHYLKIGYAGRSVHLNIINGKRKRKYIYMHRLIMNTPKGLEVDHANMNTLDNRKINLRNCTKQQNNYNKTKPKTNTSGHKGVSWYKAYKKWRAYVDIKGNFKHLGYFKNKNDAITAFKNEAPRYHKEFFRL